MEAATGLAEMNAVARAPRRKRTRLRLRHLLGLLTAISALAVVAPTASHARTPTLPDGSTRQLTVLCRSGVYRNVLATQLTSSRPSSYNVRVYFDIISLDTGRAVIVDAPAGAAYRLAKGRYVVRAKYHWFVGWNLRSHTETITFYANQDFTRSSICVI